MENKRTGEDLKMLQALPLDIKISMTKQRIREWVNWYGSDGCYVSRSGGKDSDVLGHIVKEMYPEIPQVFVNTGLEHDSVRLHAMEECDTVLRPEKSFLQVLTEYGYPVISKQVAECVRDARRHIESGYKVQKAHYDYLMGTKLNADGTKSIYCCDKYKFLIDAPFRISDLCCDHMKKLPAKHYESSTKRTPFIGILASESRLRRQKWVQNGCNAFNLVRPVSNPLSFWTDQDILHYIYKYNLELANVYGKIVPIGTTSKTLFDIDVTDDVMLTTTGATGTGCVFCMFGITQDTDRFLRLKKIEPKKYDYVMRGGKFDDKGLWIPHNGLGYKFVIDWMNEHGNLNIKY